jgi:starch synthase
MPGPVIEEIVLASKHIVMLAAENGVLKGAKVGGIADVIRDVPRALAARGHRVTVLTPGYQALSKLPGARYQHSLTVEFGGALETLELFRIDTPDEVPGVGHYVLEHPLFGACGAGNVYCHDRYEPFATDASKFALFCQAASCALVAHAFGDVDVLHLHDWHAALVLLLRQSHTAYQPLQRIPAVFTIHNLSLQGVRPFEHNLSSPGHWFRNLDYDPAPVADPLYPDCINLMRTGINLADKVHVVSPTYAREILLPSDPASGLIRGEGLEQDLRRVQQAGKLFGIINGCDYGAAKAAGSKPARKPDRKAIIAAATNALNHWVHGCDLIKAAHFHAQNRLLGWAQNKQRDAFIVGSVGRLTPQKVDLLRVETAPGVSALDALLQKLERGFMIMVGSGDADCERFMCEVMQRHENFLFLCGYSEELGELVYRFSDLFLMPSSFEPCGISQMLAMRAGTPPLVHKVGGLADTVQHLHNGFTFEGNNRAAQAEDLLRVFEEVLQLRAGKASVWQGICANAAAARFSWDVTVQDYEAQLYA